MAKDIKFDIEKTIAYWRDGAEYDLGVAEAMLKAGKYPYALFMGHLALEKLLKAIVVKKTGFHAPFTHSLPLLAAKSGLVIPEATQIKLKEFVEFHLEARYPSEQKEFYIKCKKPYTTKKFREIKEVLKWLKGKLKKS